MHDVVRALQLVQVLLATRRVDDLDAATAVGTDVNVARHQCIGRPVVDVHRRVAVGHDQVAITHRHDLTGQRNAAARQADRVQDDGLRGVVKTAGDGAVTVQGTIGAERHAADGVAVAVLQGLVLVAAERAVDLDVGVGQAALDLAVDVQRQRRNADRAQRKDARVARRRVVVQVLRERVQLGVAPLQQHVLHRVADTGAGAVALQCIDDVRPTVVEQRRVGAGVEPPFALQAEIALGHDVQAHCLDRARHIDAAQRVDDRHLAQRVDHRAQQAQVHRRACNHLGQRVIRAFVQRAAERVSRPGVLDLADVDFSRVGA